MELRQLRCFVEAAAIQNLTRAADQLHIAQPALSRHIKHLEDELGVPLFMRVGRGVVLTDAGAKLARYATQILQDVERARDSVIAEGHIPRGSVSIGAPPSAAHYFFPPLISAYQAAYPNVSVRLLEGMTYNLTNWLRSDIVDLALVSYTSTANPPTDDRDLAYIPVASEGMYVFGSRQGPRLPKRMTLSEMSKLPLILTGKPTLARLGLEKAADASGVSLDVVVEIESQAIMKDLVNKRMGFGVVPCSSLYDDIGRFTVARLEGVTMTRMLARRANRPPTPAMNELIRFATSTIEGLRAAGRFEPR